MKRIKKESKNIITCITKTIMTRTRIKRQSTGNKDMKPRKEEHKPYINHIKNMIGIKVFKDLTYQVNILLLISLILPVFIAANLTGINWAVIE